MIRHCLVAGLCCALVASANSALAVSYASGVRNLGGGDYEFILNDDAVVSVDIAGGSTLNLGSLTAGRHSFNISGGSAFEINVGSSNPADTYTRISDDSNEFLWFGRPAGLAINTDPTSSFFGTLYVANANTTTATAPGSRTLADAMYALTADQIGVDLTNFDAETDAQDTTQSVLPPGWTVSGSSNSPFRMNLDDSGNLIVTDWSDANGGIKYASPDLQTGGLILAGQGGPTGGFVGSNHGSIPSQPSVTGSVGVDLTVWALDEDMASDSGGVGGQGSAADGNNFWRWDVGAATDYDQPANLVFDPSDLPAALNGEETYLNLNVGVGSDGLYDPNRNLIYLTQNRSSGNEAGLVVVTPNGSTPTLEFSSLDFAFDNGLDGDPLAVDFIVSDILRNVGEITLSPNGDALFLSRVQVNGGTFDNPHLGVDSDNPGGVLVIPLDENGIPIIELSENGTPGDTSDDQITNWTSIDDIINGTSLGFRNGTRVDAAGNLYISSNNAERIQIYSPGGDKVATTSYNADLTGGAFAVVDGTIMPPAIPGDFDGDGDVDGADFGVFVGEFQTGDTGGPGAAAPFSQADLNMSGFVDGADFGIFVDSFQNFPPTPTAVPEPTSVALLALGGVAALVGRRC